MKIQVIDANTKKPLPNTKIKLQIKGENLALTTDNTGNLLLDEKYKGQQITTSLGQTITAKDGAILQVEAKEPVQTGGGSFK